MKGDSSTISYHPGVRPLLFASLATVLLSVVPYARIITYPFLIFSTFIHETSHAVAAIFTAGSVESLIVNWDGSGVTYSRGGIRAIVASSGYLGAAVFGSFLLVVSRNSRWVRPALLACAALVAAVTAIYAGHGNNLVILLALGLVAFLSARSQETLGSSGRLRIGSAAVILIALIVYLLLTGSLFSWMAGLLMAIGIVAVVRFASLPVAHFFLSLLAIQCSLNALQAIYNLYSLTIRGSCGNDAQTMASLTGVPAWLWAISWAVLALLSLGVSLWLFSTRPSSRK